MAPKTEVFSSRWGMLLAMLGMAVGTGNIWRFPRVAASNGGGSFLVAWLVFLMLWSVPLLILEFGMGKATRSGAIGAFMKTVGVKFTWMGSWVAFVAAAIMCYYSVVMGWTLRFFLASLQGEIPTAIPEAFWENFAGTPWALVTHAIAMGLAIFVVSKGVRGIEKATKILIPGLIVLIVILAIRAVTLPGAMEGISFLFTPKLSELTNVKIWLEALTQNAWDTGAGWGLFLTYAIYIRRRYGVIKNAFTTAIGNNIVSLLAAIMVFSTVFSILGNEMSMSKPEILEVMKTSGPAATGLTFIWMPQLFAKMPLGKPLAALFFLGLTFAGFSSLISMLELPVRNLINLGLKRTTAIGWIVTVCFVMGIPSARNLDIMGNQDFVWGVALMLSGVFVALAAVKYGLSRIIKEVSSESQNDWAFPRWWSSVVNYIVPALGAILLFWWMYQSATVYAPDDWYDPTSLYSVATCVVQWAIALAAFYMLNHWMNHRLENSIES